MLFRSHDPFGELVEEVNLRAQQSFEMAFVPKSSGQWLYQLKLQEAGTSDVLLEETVAFSVSASSKPRILLYQSAPSFESRHMKNWATEFGVSMTIATKISQQHWISQHINYAEFQGTPNVSPLQQRILNSYDLMIMDGRSWLALSAEDKAYIDTQIEQGMGMLLLVDDDIAKLTATSAFRFGDIEIKDSNSPQITREALPTFLSASWSLPVKVFDLDISILSEPLIEDSDGRPLLIAESEGLGRRAVSLLTKSYVWKTSGEMEIYGRYWQIILGQISRNNNNGKWHTGHLPFTGNPHQLCFSSQAQVSTLSHQVGQEAISEIIAQPHGFSRDQYCSTQWHEKSGWHRIHSDTTQKIEAWYYVYAQFAWQAEQQRNKHIASAAQVRQGLTSASMSNGPLNPLWYWSVLVVCLAILWIERRFF